MKWSEIEKEFDKKFCEPEDEPNGFAGHIKNVGAVPLKDFLKQKISSVLDEVGNGLAHPELCRKRGKQFKECAKCYLEDYKSNFLKE